MEEKNGARLRQPEEKGAMIGLALVVVMSILLASVAVAGRGESEPGNWKMFLDQHRGLRFEMRMPVEVTLENSKVAPVGFNLEGGWLARGTLWYEVYREGVRIGTLDVIAPVPRSSVAHSKGHEGVEIHKGDDAAFRFRTLVYRDEESLSLFKRILDTVHIQRVR